MAFDLPGVKPGSDIETLFKAVGFVVIQWGFAEQSLDLMVATIFHSFDGHLPALSRGGITVRSTPTRASGGRLLAGVIGTR